MDQPSAEVGNTPYVNVLGASVALYDFSEALASVRSMIFSRDQGYVCFCNASTTLEHRRNPALRSAYASATLVLPDGVPLVWSAKYAGARKAVQVRGADFMLKLLADSAEHGWSSFFYGSDYATLQSLVNRLKHRFPYLRVAGTYAPPFRPLTHREQLNVADTINASSADIVWVGLGAPKQELWMHELRGSLDAPVLLGVGAAFDFHAGARVEAPSVVQSVALEWLWRLLSEPKRLARRYFRDIPEFTTRVLTDPPSLNTRSGS